MFDVQMLPAQDGDSIWVEYGVNGEASHRIVIDGGRSACYKFLEKKIRSVAVESTVGICDIECLVLTHIDSDHIEGLIKLLGNKDLPVRIGDIWFNSLEDLPGLDEKEEGWLGGKHGEFLGALIRNRELPWNELWEHDSIWVPSSGPLPFVKLPGGMRITLLSPTFDKLQKLGAKWRREIEDAGMSDFSDEEVLKRLSNDKRLKPSEPFLSADLDINELIKIDPENDPSPVNGSSIAFLAEYEGKSCIFGGDAHSSTIEQSIGRLLMDRTNSSRLDLGAFKVPHHGSRGNLHEPLLQRINCVNFLFSTNGARHGHPDPETIALLLAGSWRATSERLNLIFNYRTKQNEIWDAVKQQDDWNYRAFYPPETHSNNGIGLPVPAVQVDKKFEVDRLSSPLDLARAIKESIELKDDQSLLEIAPAFKNPSYGLVIQLTDDGEIELMCSNKITVGDEGRRNGKTKRKWNADDVESMSFYGPNGEKFGLEYDPDIGILVKYRNQILLEMS